MEVTIPMKHRSLINNNKLHRDTLYEIVCVLIILGVFLYYINKTFWLPRYPDPFGYLANAAFMCGKEFDWSQVSQQMGAVYSGGYSLIIIPILPLFKNIIDVIRVLYYLNIFFLLISFAFLNKLLMRVCAGIETEHRILISLSICISPSSIYQVFTATPESMLQMMVIIMGYLISEQHYKDQINLADYSRLIAISALGPFLHLRLVIVELVVVILSFVWALRRKIQAIKAFLGLLFLCVCYRMCYLFNGYLRRGVYGIPDRLTATTSNTMAVQFTKLNKYLIHGTRIVSVMENMFTLYLYIIITTFFLAVFVTIYICILIKNSKIIMAWSDYSLFTTLAIVTMFLASAYVALNPKRWDHLIYGRYIYPFYGLLWPLAIKGMKEMRRIEYKFLVVIAIVCDIAGFLMDYRIRTETLTRSNPRTIGELILIYDWLKNDPGRFILLGRCVAIIVILIGIMYNRCKNRRRMAGVMLTAFLLIQFSGTTVLMKMELSDNAKRVDEYNALFPLYKFDELTIYAIENQNAYIDQLVAYDHSVRVIDEYEAANLMNSKTNFILHDRKDVVKDIGGVISDERVEGTLWVNGDYYEEYLRSIGVFVQLCR